MFVPDRPVAVVQKEIADRLLELDELLSLGPRRRFFTGATRTAVQLRDLGCTHPTCQVPFEQCEIDHIVPHAAGGPTTQDNGRCRCPFHHRRARDG